MPAKKRKVGGAVKREGPIQGHGASARQGAVHAAAELRVQKADVGVGEIARIQGPARVAIVDGVLKL